MHTKVNASQILFVQGFHSIHCTMRRHTVLLVLFFRIIQKNWFLFLNSHFFCDVIVVAYDDSLCDGIGCRYLLAVKFAYSFNILPHSAIFVACKLYERHMERACHIVGVFR